MGTTTVILVLEVFATSVMATHRMVVTVHQGTGVVAVVTSLTLVILVC